MRYFAITSTGNGLSFTWLPNANVLAHLNSLGCVPASAAAVRPRVASVLPYTLRLLNNVVACHFATFGLPGCITRYVWWGRGEPATALNAYYAMCQITHCQPNVLGSVHDAVYA